jgi:hypothetical protein
MCVYVYVYLFCVRMFGLVCMYVFMYVYMYVCMYVSMYEPLRKGDDSELLSVPKKDPLRCKLLLVYVCLVWHVCMHVLWGVCMHTRMSQDSMYIHTYTYVCIHELIVRIHVGSSWGACMYTRMCTYIHTRMYAYMN